MQGKYAVKLSTYIDIDIIKFRGLTPSGLSVIIYSACFQPSNFSVKTERGAASIENIFEFSLTKVYFRL